MTARATYRDAYPAPIVGRDLWTAVMELAGYQCQCTGTCGNPHKRDQGRCRVLQTRHRLAVAPEHPTGRAHTDTAVPVNALRAWCPDCLTAAIRAAKRRAESTTPNGTDTLF
jgi:hypothetical protein